MKAFRYRNCCNKRIFLKKQYFGKNFNLKNAYLITLPQCRKGYSTLLIQLQVLQYLLHRSWRISRVLQPLHHSWLHQAAQYSHKVTMKLVLLYPNQLTASWYKKCNPMQNILCLQVEKSPFSAEPTVIAKDLLQQLVWSSYDLSLTWFHQVFLWLLLIPSIFATCIC